MRLYSLSLNVMIQCFYITLAHVFSCVPYGILLLSTLKCSTLLLLFFNSGLQTDGNDGKLITYKPNAHHDAWLKCATVAISMSAGTLRLLRLFCDVTNMVFVTCVHRPWFHSRSHYECVNSTLRYCIFVYFSVWTVYTLCTQSILFFLVCNSGPTFCSLFIF